MKSNGVDKIMADFMWNESPIIKEKIVMSLPSFTELSNELIESNERYFKLSWMRKKESHFLYTS